MTPDIQLCGCDGRWLTMSTRSYNMSNSLSKRSRRKGKQIVKRLARRILEDHTSNHWLQWTPHTKWISTARRIISLQLRPNHQLLATFSTSFSHSSNPASSIRLFSLLHRRPLRHLGIFSCHHPRYKISQNSYVSVRPINTVLFILSQPHPSPTFLRSIFPLRPVSFGCWRPVTLVNLNPCMLGCQGMYSIRNRRFALLYRKDSARFWIASQHKSSLASDMSQRTYAR
jgi:hypothetical protein